MYHVLYMGDAALYSALILVCTWSGRLRTHVPGGCTFPVGMCNYITYNNTLINTTYRVTFVFRMRSY